MFVRVSIYRARSGEDDAILALHENWIGGLKHRGLITGELLRENGDERTIVAILHFASEALAVAVEADPAHEDLAHRLASLTVVEPVHLHCRRTWQAHGSQPAGPDGRLLHGFQGGEADQ